MAVVDIYTTELTNANAGTRNDNHHIGGRAKILSATIESAAGDDDGSVYRFFRLKSGWSVKSIKVYTDDPGTTAFDCGLYTINGGAVVDDDAYASAVDLDNADVAGTELAFEARGITAINQRVYEDAGESVDSLLEYDLALTGDTVGTGTSLTLVATVTVGD